MKCPKCMEDQPDGAVECSRCGIVFSKWQRTQEPFSARPLPRGGVSLPAGKGNGSSGKKSLMTAIKILVLLGVAAGWYWFMFSTSAGLLIPEKAYQDPENGFAITTPAGWQHKKVKNCQKGTGILDTASVCAVLEFQRTGGWGKSDPFAQVIVAPVSAFFKTGWGGSVHLSEGSREDLARELEKGIAVVIPGFKFETSELLTVDNISSIRVVGSGPVKGNTVMIGDRHITVPDFTGRSYERRVTIGGVLVPAGRNAYLIMFGCERDDYPGLKGSFEKLAVSFRVTEGRPTPFQAAGGLLGSIKGDLIMGLLFGLTLANIKI